jgi:UDP-2,4-diacetamido-2,4,6-trideoxy-beta-L-altropyranose hydrolase
MRCLALAQAWQDANGDVTFLMTPGPQTLEDRLRREGFGIVPLSSAPGMPEDAGEVCALAHDLSASWIVLDGYHFGERYQELVYREGTRVMCVDDMGGEWHYSSDIILNQNYRAQASLYPNTEPDTELLLGTKYSLLRREFARHAGWHRDSSSVGNRLLVTMGGGDGDNTTLTVMRGLNLASLDLEVVVVIGPGNRHRSEIEEFARRSKSVTTRADVQDMSELMRWADIAISASGSTCWEIALMQLPSLLITMAPNQEPLAAALAEAGAAEILGRASALTPELVAAGVTKFSNAREKHAAMRRACEKLVDGRGAEWVTKRLLSSN